MSNKSGTASQVISLPNGGGALQGIGETFAPDLFTGTGNFTVPIALPPGRNGFQPELSLVYSTGNGNSPFGLGWSLSVPGVSRKTSKGVPRYRDNSSDSEERDTFVLSGAEDLVQITERQDSVARFRPRTEGLFARIGHMQDTENDFWRVRTKDGLVSLYGTAASAGNDPAVVADPEDRSKVGSWGLTETTDSFGNRIEYQYFRNLGEDGPHVWDQLYLERIQYVDYEKNGETRFLVSVTFVYEERPDPFSNHRSGFESRTRFRCKRIEVRTHPDEDLLVRTYELVYLDERVSAGELPESSLPLNGVSLLSHVKVVSRDGNQTQELPPLEFGYTQFEPSKRRFQSLNAENNSMPTQSLAHDDFEMVDLFGNGLPDIVQMNGFAQYWRNRGGGTFDRPELMEEIPSNVQLKDPRVQFADLNGNGRADLLVQHLGGFFPLSFQGRFSKEGFISYEHVPSVELFGPATVRLMDLDGDGVVDALHTGDEHFELFFNDPETGWSEVESRPRQHDLADFPDLSFSDPQVKLADMTGDGLQDFVLVSQGQIDYWPYLGHGRWGRRVRMETSPVFDDSAPLPGIGFDPKRVLFGDLDGDGLDDVVHIEPNRITVWINQGGNRWSKPFSINNTPTFTDADAVRLADMLGTGTEGILWTADQMTPLDNTYQFLELTGGAKPYLLNEMNNHMGAVTRIAYTPSSKFYLADEKDPHRRWKTPLPFPVQVVECVEVIDELSQGKLTMEYRYHHGYWDGAEREFRGFGRVEQLDTETFKRFNEPGLHDDATQFNRVEETQFSPPTLTKTWFHLGPIGDESGERREADFAVEYWVEDPPVLKRPAEMIAFLEALPRQPQADALRSLQGNILRTELYALDDTAREERPYTVSETLFGVREESPPEDAGSDRQRIFFPHPLAQRTTQWERGNEPMTAFAFTDGYDQYGQPGRQVSLTVPRRRDFRATALAAVPYLGTVTTTTYAQRDDDVRYIVDRVASTSAFEIKNDGSAALLDLYRDVLAGNAQLEQFAQAFNYYDGEAFVGREHGELGDFGALVRSESLVLTEDILRAAYEDEAADSPMPALELPPYLDPNQPPPWTDEYPPEFRDHVEELPALSGYMFHTGGDEHARGYFATTTRNKFDFQDENPSNPRGLLTVIRDPLGHDPSPGEPADRDTTIEYDEFDLLPVTVTDPVGLSTHASYDLRVLQPEEVTDPNGNRSRFAYTPLGLLKSTAVMAKEGEALGDTDDEPGTRFEYNLQRELDLDQTLQVDLDNAFLSPEIRQGFEHRGISLSSTASISVLEAGSRWLVQDENVTYRITKEEKRLVVVGQPISVRTIQRVHHINETDVPLSERDETIETVEYSDGFGRLLQTRIQAEDVLFGDGDLDAPLFGNDVLPADQNDADGTKAAVVGRKRGSNDPENVVVSGWQLYDNKGQVVERFEPFYSKGFDYLSPEDEERDVFGQKVTMFYDPRGQVIRTLNPDGSEQRVIYGVPGAILTPDLTNPNEFEPTPWEAYTFDANDLAPLSEGPFPDGLIGPLTDRAPRHHHFTPSNIVIDALGRTVLAVERNRETSENANAPLPPIEEFHTRSEYDIRGNLLKVTDALQRDAFIYLYDLANNPLRIENIDAGVRRTILDATGNEIERRDSKGALILQVYDRLHRPTRLWARNDKEDVVTLGERLEYGDGGDPVQETVAREENRALNRLGALHRHYDEAGLLEFEQYDFKGNVLEKSRRMIRDDAILAVFPDANDPNADWNIRALRVDWDPLQQQETVLLDDKRYETSVTYDALNRLKMLQYPRDVNQQRKVLKLDYNRAGALEQVILADDMAAEGVIFVEHIAYDAKGQRTLVALGNGVMTRYAYDLHTFQLVRLRTERYDKPVVTEPTYQPVGQPLQDFAYEYDLAGNIGAIHDRAPDSGVPNTLLGIDALDRKFEYDAIYRLTFATGRECDRPAELPPELFNPLPRCTDITKTRRYNERYRHDPLGNMEELRHIIFTDQNNVNGFVRAFDHVPGTNRLLKMTIGENPFNYRYDTNGNIIGETLSRHFEWDHSDRMRVFRNQVEGGNGELSEPTVHTHYLYDSGGMRVKKLVRKQGGQVEVTEYIDGLFEYQRASGVENNTLHIMDDETRIATVRAGTVFPDDTTPAVKYHIGDHLGGSNVVVSAGGEFINREEYTPYGETSFGSFARKRYRFTGKERDEESGLYYYGARHYAPWLTRWINTDPALHVDGPNLYWFARCNPIGRVDRDGTQSSETSEHRTRDRGDKDPTVPVEDFSRAARERSRVAEEKKSRKSLERQQRKLRRDFRRNRRLLKNVAREGRLVARDVLDPYSVLEAEEETELQRAEARRGGWLKSWWWGDREAIKKFFKKQREELAKEVPRDWIKRLEYFEKKFMNDVIEQTERIAQLQRRVDTLKRSLSALYEQDARTEAEKTGREREPEHPDYAQIREIRRDIKFIEEEIQVETRILGSLVKELPGKLIRVNEAISREEGRRRIKSWLKKKLRW
jgi:RHS repeat-associated protein